MSVRNQLNKCQFLNAVARIEATRAKWGVATNWLIFRGQVHKRSTLCLELAQYECFANLTATELPCNFCFCRDILWGSFIAPALCGSARVQDQKLIQLKKWKKMIKVLIMRKSWNYYPNQNKSSRTLWCNSTEMLLMNKTKSTSYNLQSKDSRMSSPRTMKASRIKLRYYQRSCSKRARKQLQRWQPRKLQTKNSRKRNQSLSVFLPYWIRRSSNGNLPMNVTKSSSKDWRNRCRRMGFDHRLKV